MMLERSIDFYCKHAALKGTAFFDRGIPDALCYARLAGLPLAEEVFEACGMYRYAPQVFLAPPWEQIYVTDAERWQSFEEAVMTYGMMAEAYRDCGYEVVEIPRVSPAGRADFILGRLSL